MPRTIRRTVTVVTTTTWTIDWDNRAAEPAEAAEAAPAVSEAMLRLEASRPPQAMAGPDQELDETNSA